MHGVNRHENRWVTDRCRGYSTDCRFRMPMMVYIGIVQHDLPSATQLPGPIRLALNEAIDYPAMEVRRTRAFRKFQASVADGFVDTVNVKRVPHDAVTDLKTSARSCLVAKKHDLSTIELDTRGT